MVFFVLRYADSVESAPQKISVLRPNFGLVVRTVALSILANTVLDCLVPRQKQLFVPVC